VNSHLPYFAARYLKKNFAELKVKKGKHLSVSLVNRRTGGHKIHPAGSAIQFLGCGSNVGFSCFYFFLFFFFSTSPFYSEAMIKQMILCDGQLSPKLKHKINKIKMQKK